MQVTKMDAGEASYNIPKPSDIDMQKEYRYIIAEQITGKLLQKGLISEEEYNRIMEKNRESFSPYISKLLA